MLCNFHLLSGMLPKESKDYKWMSLVRASIDSIKALFTDPFYTGPIFDRTKLKADKFYKIKYM